MQFAFGVVADVQYADAPDGSNHKKTMARYYRGALTVLTRAVEYYNSFAVPLSFVAQLGDLIDGKNAEMGASTLALDKCLAVISNSTAPFVHCVGNHELYNFDRDILATKLQTRPNGRTVEFYAFSPVAGWRVVVLDAFQEAVVGWPQDDERRQRAVAFLRSKHPGGFNPDDWIGNLEGEDRRFTPVNGAFGEVQLAWLGKQVDSAADAGERIIVLSNVVLNPAACHGTTMAWDCHGALRAISSRPGVVAAVICGHEHKGGYALDPQSGIHHLTLCSPLNEGASGSAFGCLCVYTDRIEVHSPRLHSLLPRESLSDAGLYPRQAQGGTGSIDGSGARATDGKGREEQFLVLPL
jgi:manganese-dependent ADP-ribose/CDP-alcohol diphosphatase